MMHKKIVNMIMACCLVASCTEIVVLLMVLLRDAELTVARFGELMIKKSTNE